MASVGENAALAPSSLAARFNAWLCGVVGYALLAVLVAGAASLVTWNIADPSLTHATSGPTRNALGPVGAIFSDLVMQLLGLAGVCVILPPVFWSLELIGKGKLDGARAKLALAPVAIVLLACAASSLPKIAGWPLPYGLGGLLGDVALRAVTSVLAMIRPERASAAAGLFCFAGGIMLFMTSLGLSQRDLKLIFKTPRGASFGFVKRAWRRLGEMSEHRATVARREPVLDAPAPPHFAMPPYAPSAGPAFGPAPPDYAQPRVHQPAFDPAFDVPVTDSVDPDVKRIAGRFAPKSPAGGAARAGDENDRAELLTPQAGAAHAEDPIHAARQVMASPSDPTWQARSPSAFRFPEQAPQASADYVPEHRVPERRPPAAMAPPEPEGWRPQNMPGGDALYGQAVAIVLGDRKASAGYLERRLKIGYMRAADLIDRMEREGILGAPVYNGLRPILIGGPGSSEV